ncbi:helix-hairpin-helix domain-containing protein [Burkholderia oklahomensis]|uniref:Helix-hairpin-helix domain protein n=1 Tax=Burkholderia oklahomensis TaxID=342113 RepID=A0AAI8FS61_9BURK|nr:helix-hairpin-helix domain-containing protein [Burkholderia oklahomensis]AIO70954.1 helix-hairpin-helix domain protein [Burkholderia oklahomensis]AOI40612.1 DNA-binding protein [Burkholderia oklahomensis EO147]KUY51623.1 DNA-binding protein [Burkholderia oklahomensis EO147]QPS39994.1 DNA-binding protein [Burkholderia oklahomensis]
MQTALPTAATDNRHIADRLLEAAQRLDAQGANPYRAGAYRSAADTIASLDRDVRELFDAGGIEALDALPHIGLGIARAIAEMLITDRWRQLDRLRGSASPTLSFRMVPGVGQALAERIHDALHIDTLEDLELAVHDGRLATVEGLGPRRIAGIRAALEDLLSRRRGRQALMRRATPALEPPVSVLLDVDRLYREKAAAGTLPMIAPKRLNPRREPWLPVLHATRDDWHFTALYSNTGRAHELGRTADWVILYFYDHEHDEYQRTVVTETRGALAGRRVVRGREAECRAHYAAGANSTR